MNINEIHIGQSYSLRRTFSLEDINAFSALSLDNNPLHSNPTYASQSRFGQVVVPGMLSATLFSAIIGSHFPGSGSIYLSQGLKFLKPVYPNHEVEATVTVTSINKERNRIIVETILKDHEGNTLIAGDALIQLQ